MHETRTLLRQLSLAMLVAFAALATLGAQAPPPGMKVTPISDLRPDWLNDGVESPNGRFFVFNGYAGNVFVRYDRVTKQWATRPEVSLDGQVRWSPDGRFLAFSHMPRNPRERSVWILPMDSSTGLPSGTARRVSVSPGTGPAWSPDGRRIAYSVQDSGRFRLVTIPFNGGDETAVYGAPGRGGDVAWSPDTCHLCPRVVPSR